MVMAVSLWMVVILMYLRGNFPHELGRDYRSDVVHVAGRIQFDYIRTNDPSLLLGDNGQDFAHS
jgi:hypothetical protein